MGNIVLLDDLTINKIAAGEVIERPASVVKEMVENSIDAGADNITVEIKNGGISFIKVSDNGKGIAKDDLEIAFERHATSKIRQAEDLDTVTSMGFRGEALASIAAISHVELVSKTVDSDIGYKVSLEAGDVVEKEEAACPNGTAITVTNLFFNTPVRYKFLKKDYTESGYIEDTITRIALVNPNIAIKLISSGKTVIQTNGNGQIKDVIYSIYGKDIASAVVDVNYKYEDIEISGVIGKPEIARSNRSNQLFFVNKRYIKDKALTAATEQAYKGIIPIGKFGFVILNITMNPAKVDVNVHPAKLEVRFEEENKIFQSIYHSIKNTLLENELVANTTKVTTSKKTVDFNAVGTGVRAIPFEARLAEKMEEKEQNKKKNGLFGFGRQNNKQIEKYVEEESEIKTNNILEDIYKGKKDAKSEIESTNVQATKNVVSDVETNYKTDNSVTTAINTSDVLLKLKQLQADLQNDLKEKNVVDRPVEKEEKNIFEKNTTINAESILDSFKKKQENLENKTEKTKEELEKIPNINSEESVEETQKIETVEEKNEKLDFIKDKIDELETNPSAVTEDFKEMYLKLFGTLPKSEEEIQQEEENKKEESKISAIDIVKDNVSVFEDEPTFSTPKYKFIGIVFNTYIIIEMDKEMYILDQHAAHERIMYEKVKQNYYSETDKDSQMLLLPDVITLTHKEMDIARENIDMFRKAGFELEEFGENTIKLIGCPTVCIDLDTKELFMETLDEINTVARTAKQEKEEKFIATVACKAAVKANMVLNEAEVESLMNKLLVLPNPFTCPHGRPTAIKMTKYDIERKFARK